MWRNVVESYRPLEQAWVRSSNLELGNQEGEEIKLSSIIG